MSAMKNYVDSDRDFIDHGSFRTNFKFSLSFAINGLPNQTGSEINGLPVLFSTISGVTVQVMDSGVMDSINGYTTLIPTSFQVTRCHW